MHHISGCLPVSTMIQGWREFVLIRFIFVVGENIKEIIHTTTGIIWIYSVLAAPEQFMAFMSLKFVYFSALVSCVEFDCLGLLPPSLSGPSVVWLRLAVRVWECQWLSVCHAVRRIRSVCKLRSRKSSETFSFSNWEQNNNTGNV